MRMTMRMMIYNYSMLGTKLCSVRVFADNSRWLLWLWLS